MYHGVDDDSSTRFNYRFIGVSSLEKQLVYFKKKYHVISLSDYFEGKFRIGKPNMAITFDDGYENWLTLSLPIIEKHQVPVTFFITSFLDSGASILWADLVDIANVLLDEDIFVGDNHYTKNGSPKVYICTQSGVSLKSVLKKSDAASIKKVCDVLLNSISNAELEKVRLYWELLNPEQIIRLSECPFVEIGSHSYLHTSLGEIGTQSAKLELKHSKQYLEKIIQKEITSLAYPSGSYNQKLKNIAQDLGYEKQLAVDYQNKEDILDTRILDRIGVYTHLGYGLQLKKYLK